MNNRNITLLLSFLLFCACEQKDITEELIGTWENTSLTVDIKLPDGRDSSMVVPQGSWEEVLGIRPIVSTFNADGTFKSEYFSLEGQPIGTESGSWLVHNDSLFLTYAGSDNAYKVAFEGNKVRFTGLIDWGQGGKADDLYDGWQIRVKED